jgi:enediyne biosynthesis protein E4
MSRIFRMNPASAPVIAGAAACLLAGFAVSAVSDSTIRFEDVTAGSKLEFSSDSSPTPNKNQPEAMVAGVGLIDYDNDGYLDIYFANGAAIPSLRKEGDRYKNRLFHNNGDRTFTDVTDRAGVAGDGYDIGVAVGDYDNDGWPDIYVASVTANHLYRNRRDGAFEDVTGKARVGGGIYKGRKMWSAAAGWFDYDNDGRLDLFVSNYCRWEVNKDPLCLKGGRLRAYCHPKLYEALPCTLYHNNGDGTFTDVSLETGIGKVLGKGMGVAFNDYDGDSFTDVFVANDNTPNSLFHNLRGRAFEEVALEAGVAYAENGKVVGGMGAEFRDLDNDGRPDVWQTAPETETFSLFHNAGGGMFVDVTASSGLGKATRDMSGWSNSVGDFDNDGLKDLFTARSNVLDNIAEFSSRAYEEPNSLFRNLGKMRFEEVTVSAGPALQVAAANRGSAVGDLDNDGRLDIVVPVLNSRAKVFRNASVNENHWVAFQLVGSKSNRMGIGAQIRVTGDDGLVQHDMVSTSGGYAASCDHRVHFGLGRSQAIREVQIRWPSGSRQVLGTLPAGRIHRIEEPAN